MGPSAEARRQFIKNLSDYKLETYLDLFIERIHPTLMIYFITFFITFFPVIAVAVRTPEKSAAATPQVTMS